MARELLFPGTFVFKSIRSQEHSLPITFIPRHVQLFIRLDCTPCYAYILMICCWRRIAQLSPEAALKFYAMKFVDDDDDDD